MRFDDDDAIEVDEAIDQLTEMIFVPPHSPAREVQHAIVLPMRTEVAPPRKSKSARPSLIILPDDVASLGAPPESPPARTMQKSARTRSMQLSPFAAKAGASGSTL